MNAVTFSEPIPRISYVKQMMTCGQGRCNIWSNNDKGEWRHWLLWSCYNERSLKFVCLVLSVLSPFLFSLGIRFSVSILKNSSPFCRDSFSFNNSNVNETMESKWKRQSKWKTSTKTFFCFSARKFKNQYRVDFTNHSILEDKTILNPLMTFRMYNQMTHPFLYIRKHKIQNSQNL